MDPAAPGLGFCVAEPPRPQPDRPIGYNPSVKYWLALLAAVSAAAQIPDLPVAIRDARIVTVSGGVVNKGTVVLRRGLIEAAGENVAVPAGA